MNKVWLLILISCNLIAFKSYTQETKNQYSFRSINWDALINGTYSVTEAKSDFGSLIGWKEKRTSVVDGTMRLLIEKNALSGAGGIVANVDIPEASAYELSFKVKFDENFDWGRGGKVGFGLRIGNGNAGCNKADGDGASARMMWYDLGEKVVFKPYLYYYDMPGQCGDNLIKSAKYPVEGSLQKNQWYTIKIYVKSNTGNQHNGRVKYTVEGTVILDEPIRWTTNDAKRLINKLAFSTFRGGSTMDWASSTDGYVYFDEVSWKKLED